MFLRRCLHQELLTLNGSFSVVRSPFSVSGDWNRKLLRMESRVETFGNTALLFPYKWAKHKSIWKQWCHSPASRMSVKVPAHFFHRQPAGFWTATEIWHWTAWSRLYWVYIPPSAQIVRTIPHDVVNLEKSTTAPTDTLQSVQSFLGIRVTGVPFRNDAAEPFRNAKKKRGSTACVNVAWVRSVLSAAVLLTALTPRARTLWSTIEPDLLPPPPFEPSNYIPFIVFLW